MKERRAFPRLDEPALVNYIVLDKTSQETRSVSDDISRGGVRFPIDEKLKTGSVLNLKIEIPFASLSIVGKGIIVWQKKLDREIGKWRYVVGIEFTDMAPADEKELRNFLNGHLDKKPKNRI